jgi:tetratricopeptide (TPR) repeat protein
MRRREAGGERREGALWRLRAAVATICILSAAGGVLSQQPEETPAALLAEGRRQFEMFQYQQAIGMFDRAIPLLMRAAPSDGNLLTEAYELRGRAAFALGNRANMEKDFAALLAVRPDYTLAPTVSPTIVGVFTAIKKQTVGQLLLATVPDAEVALDGRRFTIREGAPGIDLTAGEHTLTAARAGYRPVSQTVTIRPGETESVTITLERVTSTLRVTTLPAGVEVVLDGKPRGLTSPSADRGDPAASLTIEEVASGDHRIELRRACYLPIGRGVPIDSPADFVVGPFQLERAVASVKIETTERDVTLYLDGKPIGPAPGELNDLCEGPHVIEARSPQGRFIDRRTWKAGETQALRAQLRPALALVDVAGQKDERIAAELRIGVEQALARASGVMLFAPPDAEIEGAYKSAGAARGTLAGQTVNRDNRREIGRRLASRLETQGVAWIEATSDRDTVVLAVLADGSGEPDRVTLRLTDVRSRTAVLDAMNARPMTLLQPTIDASVVDAAGESGVVIVRVPKAGAAATSGLAAGDVIAKVGQTAIGSVADLAGQLVAAPPNLPVTLTVRSRTGQEREVAVAPAQAPQIPGLRERGLLWNKFLLDMRETARANATSPRVQTAARMATALAHMRLGNWEAARDELDQVTTEAAAAWSATLAYLNGLSFEGLGRTADARAAFERAAAAIDTSLFDTGPSVTLLAQQKLRAR